MRQLQYITILLILMVAIPLLGQSIDGDAIEGNKLIASKYEMNFQDGKGWRFPDSTQFKYDDLDRLVEKKLYRLKDSTWTLIEVEIREYQDNKYTIALESLRDGQFVTSVYHEENYNDKGLVTNTLIQFGYNGVLQNEWQYLYTYDINCNLIERNIKVWEEEKWLDYDRKNFEYDDRNNLIYELFESWENDEWTTNTENNYEYDSLNVLWLLREATRLDWEDCQQEIIGFFCQMQNKENWLRK